LDLDLKVFLFQVFFDLKLYLRFGQLLKYRIPIVLDLMDLLLIALYELKGKKCNNLLSVFFFSL